MNKKVYDGPVKKYLNNILIKKFFVTCKIVSIMSKS